MKQEHPILRQVEQAKADMRAANALIGAYMPFIKAQVAQFLGRPPVEGQDDTLSVAMIAFHEAIVHYTRERGAFLAYAALRIRSRLIDFQRSQARHGQTVSLHAPVDDKGTPLAHTLPGEDDHADTVVLRQATRAEIEELARQMRAFGVTFTDVAQNAPRQQRTLQACRDAVQRAMQTPGLLETFVRTKRLPLGQLCTDGAERKTLERHRKYLVALLLIQTNGYEIIRGHLMQVMGGRQR